MKRLLLILAPALSLCAADITGKWHGSIDVADPGGGRTIKTPVRAEFEQKANSVSGKIGRREDEGTVSIRNGKVEGSRISFEVSSAETLGAVQFDLTLEGDRMEGEMRGAVDVGQIVGRVSLTRQKERAQSSQ
jgi:hypothetical protein